MVHCSATNCFNNSNNYRLYQFPADRNRRLSWAKNARRKWGENEPTQCMKLCEVHFEDSQFELNRQDGKKKLKWNAVPTLFDVPNPPRKIVYKKPSSSRVCPLQTGNEENVVLVPEVVERRDDNCVHKRELVTLKGEFDALAEKYRKVHIEKKKLLDKQRETFETLNRFLRPDQMKYLNRHASKNTQKWSEDTLKMALRLRSATGAAGYKLLREEGYPLPAYRTICKCIKDIH